MSTGRTGAVAPDSAPTKNGHKNAGAFKPGNKLGGGKKGRSGRKPLAFKVECERLRDTEVLAKVAAYLAKSDPGDDAWVWCAEYVTKYTTSPAPAKVEATGEGGGPIRFTLAIGERDRAGG